jgi:hypothetical protein
MFDVSLSVRVSLRRWASGLAKGALEVKARRIVALCLLSVASSCAQPADLAALLRQARSFRCFFTVTAVTTFKDGRRTIEVTHEKGTVVYDNIDLQRGTARVVGNVGAGDLKVTWSAGALWFVEQAPAGNLIVTTIFPAYEEGTREFVVVESRHWFIGQFASGEQSSGSCRLLE